MAPPTIDVWTLASGTGAWRRGLEGSGWVLSEAELRSADRFVGQTRKEQALLARCVLREALSHRWGGPPETWAINAAPRGRPRLREPKLPSIDFSLSHSQGFVGCALASQIRVGLDLEPVERSADIGRVAHLFLSKGEEDLLAGFPTMQAEQMMLRLWTLKEALAKGVGLGLQLDLRQFSFAGTIIDSGRPIRCPEARRWRFETWEHEAGFSISLAYRANGPDISVSKRDGSRLF